MNYFFGKKFQLTRKSLSRFTSKELIMIFYSESLPLKKILIDYLIHRGIKKYNEKK